MSVSQSRYSIVERLTQEKLNILGRKSTLAADIDNKRRELARLEQELEDFKINAKASLESQVMERKQQIKGLILHITHMENSLSDKQEALDKKMEAVDQALEQLQEISRNAVDNPREKE